MLGLVLVFGLWWAYFKHASGISDRLSLRAAIGWGYGHYAVFASVAALGAGLQVAAESVFGHVALTDATVALLVAVPVDVYLVSVGLLHAWPLRRPVLAPIAVACLAILGAAFSAEWIGVPLAVLAIALIVAGMVAYNLVVLQRETEREPVSSET